MSRQKRIYLVVASLMVAFLLAFAMYATPLTQQARWDDSAALSLALVLMFLVPFFILAWSLTNLFGRPNRRDKSTLT